MKITLTHAEMTSMVIKHLGLANISNVTSVEISDTPEIALNGFLTQLDKVTTEVNRSNKIAAIKEYRGLTQCGLKEAKDVIETWWFALNEMKRRKAFIVPSYALGSDGYQHICAVEEWRSV